MEFKLKVINEKVQIRGKSLSNLEEEKEIKKCLFYFKKLLIKQGFSVILENVQAGEPYFCLYGSEAEF